MVTKQNVELYAKDSAGKWVLSKKASPGNLQSFEDLLFHRSDMSESSVIMAVRLSVAADGKVWNGVRAVCLCVSV